MPPQGRTNRTHSGAAGALLLPELLARTGYLPADLRLRRTGTDARAVVADSFVNQRLIHFRAKDFVAQIERSDDLIAEIENINARHCSTSWPYAPARNRR